MPRCRLTVEKTHRREVGYCTTADETDINRAIIAQGAAFACPRYDDHYVPLEQAAALAANPGSRRTTNMFILAFGLVSERCPRAGTPRCGT